MKKIVVSGGSGFVATWVIVELLNHHYAVSASLRSLTKADGIRESMSHYVPAEDLANLSFFKADLTSIDGWKAGMENADGVIHVASPLGNGTESTEELVSVAKGGVLNVLQAAENAGIIRVVMTSSQAAATPLSTATGTFDESFWTDLNNPELDPYRISKVKAEQAAWTFAQDHNIELTTILPGAIFGPVITSNLSSNGILLQLLKGQPALPKVPLEISDVRDLARLHRLAFEKPQAIGKRYIGSSQTLTMLEVGKIYQSAFPSLHLHVRALPNWATRLLAKFIPSLRSLVPMLNRRYHHTAAAAENDLGWQQHEPQQTVIDAANRLIKLGFVKK
ncbi:NAD-dependent epimerase/dehydratase family protein [Furfurilactobacillus rossiae]|uniref:Dehydrogenase n=1 Tax=Furfurilactobacillus rossiae DSM 15814 TaxID=1114972 RepID=A0A0R1RM40_9LACO|nr:NAD-dependent epimerase/dehydratase family protein [Furfurilactobacillus rossiae]KRL57198.1 dehydrogenase [Furfurilactobacillus rossiae DSM 15814]QFR65916.1 NAD-dependent epimerase/dehydratase family protein [Furfurilactobacillus rossiae]QLE61332.1 oxidoreductase putative [Furfurilactobacillus rossiae]